MKSTYLDYAAATPLDDEVLQAMLKYLRDEFYNPSATYLAGRSARKAIEAARHSVAQNLGAKAAEIVFTAGATEANNLAISGVLSRFPGAEIITSAIEHESVLAPAAQYPHKIAPVDKQGLVDINKLEKLINKKTVLVSIGLVNNEIGTVQPLRQMSVLLEQNRKKRKNSLPLYFHSDAAQAPCYQDFHVSRVGIDLMSLNGGKIYGPKQTGALYVKAGVGLKPLILGGGQEMNLRSGTENVANCVGLAAALKKAVELRKTESDHADSLRRLFIEGLAQIPSSAVNSPAKNCSPHIINVRFNGMDNERLMMELDEAGIQVAVGSACSASSNEPSHVLKAIGLTDGEARSSLRFSFGRQTTKADIMASLKQLRQQVNR